MNNTKKMTKKDYFTDILNKYPLTDAEKNFINHELELLEKKNSSDKKPTATQTANVGIKTAIYNGMEPNRLYAIKELVKEIPECAELSNQRISALLRQMYEGADPTIERIEDKRKAYFRKIL
jgi:hypothetical protein